MAPAHLSLMSHTGGKEAAGTRGWFRTGAIIYIRTLVPRTWSRRCCCMMPHVSPTQSIALKQEVEKSGEPRAAAPPPHLENTYGAFIRTLSARPQQRRSALKQVRAQQRKPDMQLFLAAIVEQQRRLSANKMTPQPQSRSSDGRVLLPHWALLRPEPCACCVTT